MLDLTPGERRGALTLLVLLLLGTAQDLWQARQPPVGLPPVAARSASGVNSVQAPGPAGAPARAVAALPAGPVDLNRATAQELDALPGIGPVLAGRIVAHRARVGPFRSREDLFAVQGIGPKLFARLAPLVSVQAPGPAAPTPDAPPAGRRAKRPMR